VPVLEELRADLYVSVKAACLAKAKQINDERPELPLPTEATIEEFSQWISTSSAPVANAHLSVNMGPVVPGASRLVGAPDMPDNLDWPHHGGRALGFLAQINLASLPPGVDWPVPRSGWLYLFLGANPDGVAVGDVDASPNRTLYFGGDVSELRTRVPPDGTIIPPEFQNAAPYSVSFELGLSVPMGMAGAVATPWNRFPNVGALDLGSLLLDTKPAVVYECKDRMFGLPRHDQIYNSQFQAAATTAGYGSVVHLAAMTMEEYRRRAPAAKRPPSPNLTRLFEEMKARQTALEDEAKYWCPLFSLGSHLHKGAGKGDRTWHFNWWDAQTYRILIDERKSRSGEFSQTFICVSD
jgi:hypothetical protein